MTNKILCIKLTGNSFEDWFSLKFREHDCDIIGWQEFYDAGSDRYLGEGIKRLIVSCKNARKIVKKYSINSYDKIIIFDKYDIFLSLLPFVDSKKIFLYMWNSLGIKQGNFLKALNKVWNKRMYTFDSGDAKRYQLEYNTQFYFFDKIELQKEGKGLFFIGQDKERYHLLKNLKQVCLEHNLVYDFKIVPSLDASYDEADKDLIYNGFLPYDQVRASVKKCEAVVDLVQKGQVGLTIRSMEAMLYNKKIITNNASLKEQPFFNENMIFILDDRPLSELEGFLKKEGNYDQDKIWSYDYSSWIKRFHL